MTTISTQAISGAAPAEDRYFQGDPIPVAEIIEEDSDQAWALWDLVTALVTWRTDASPAN